MRVFISYCRADSKLKDLFRQHLTTLAPKFNLAIFDDGEILPGQDWERQIWNRFEHSQIIFVLVSAAFINSEFCFKKEFKLAIARHYQKRAVVVPIILKPCGWKNVRPLARLQVLPHGQDSIGGGFKTLDMGFANVVTSLNTLLTTLAMTRRGQLGRRPSRPQLKDYGVTKYRAVLFDLDGTLVRGRVGYEEFRYSWQLVWAQLGYPDSQRRKYYQQYFDGKITYQEWCGITRDLFRTRRLSRAHFAQIAKKVRLTKNCKDTLRILRAKGLKTVLVSGGINSLLEAVFPDYGEYFDDVFINRFEFDDEGVLKEIHTTPYDFRGKYDAIVETCRKYHLKEEECVFVGEGRNDIDAAKELSLAGGLTIGYPADLIRDYVDHELWKDRLDAILDVIFNRAPAARKLRFPE